MRRRSFDPLEWVGGSTLVEGCGRGFEYSPGFEFAARVLEASLQGNRSYAAKQSFTASVLKATLREYVQGSCALMLLSGA